jgi:predicted pyridoxine 5'-phosphate oxidase superfamily flavin-nucleotide-binding protein
MIKMTELMARLLTSSAADGVPTLVGTVSKDGRPQISPKGSVNVYNDDTLCFWERSYRSVEKNLTENPRVVVYYRNQTRSKEIPYASAALRFHGVARVVKDGPERERVWALTISGEQQRDPEKKGYAVLIKVDLIEELSGNVVMKAD